MSCFCKNEFRSKTIILILAFLSGNIPSNANSYESGEFTYNESYFHVLIYSDGVLKGLGHDHVIAATNWLGNYEIKNNGDLKIYMKIDVASLDVDDVKNRAKHPYLSKKAQPSEKAVHGTKQNMLSKNILDAKNYPYIRTIIVGNINTRQIKIDISIKDHKAEVSTKFDLECANGVVKAKGNFRFNHADLGLRPYSVFFGSIKVAEPIDFYFVAAVSSDCKEITNIK